MNEESVNTSILIYVLSPEPRTDLTTSKQTAADKNVHCRFKRSIVHKTLFPVFI